jgi:hypothetical protein
VKKRKKTAKRNFVSAHDYMQMFDAKYMAPVTNVRMRSDEGVEEGKKWTEYNSS